MVPTARVSLHVPVIVPVRPLESIPMVRLVASPISAAEADQHSPPDLYTLHASLLI